MTTGWRHFLDRSARVAALLGTSYFLIATSAPTVPEQPPPYNNGTSQSCQHAAQTMGFHVSGNCGPEGNIVVSSPAGQCAIMVQGATAVGLPSAGRFESSFGSEGSLGTEPWHLSGYVAETTAAGQGDAAVFTVVRDGGVQTASDAQPIVVTALPHGNAVLRLCVASAAGNGATSIACTDDDRASCAAVLTPLP